MKLRENTVTFGNLWNLWPKKGRTWARSQPSSRGEKKAKSGLAIKFLARESSLLLEVAAGFGLRKREMIRRFYVYPSTKSEKTFLLSSSWPLNAEKKKRSQKSTTQSRTSDHDHSGFCDNPLGSVVPRFDLRTSEVIKYYTSQSQAFEFMLSVSLWLRHVYTEPYKSSLPIPVDAYTFGSSDVVLEDSVREPKFSERFQICRLENLWDYKVEKLFYLVLSDN